jgi:hypothetical protein
MGNARTIISVCVRLRNHAGIRAVQPCILTTSNFGLREIASYFRDWKYSRLSFVILSTGFAATRQTLIQSEQE